MAEGEGRKMVNTSLSCDADDATRGISGVCAADAGVSDCVAAGASAATMRGVGGVGLGPPAARFMVAKDAGGAGRGR